MAHFRARNLWLETPLAATDRAPRPWWRSEWTWICICFGCHRWMLISKQDHFLFSRTKLQIGGHLYPSWNKYTFFKTYIWTTKPIYHNQLNFGHCWRSSTCSKDHVNWPGNLSWFWTTLVELGTKHLESWKLDARQSSYHRNISLQMQLSVTISSYQHQWLSPIFLASQVIHFHIFPMNNGIGLGCPCSSSLGNPSKDHLTVMMGDDGGENVPTPPSQAETNGCMPV